MSTPIRKSIILEEYKYKKANITDSDILVESLHTFSQQHEIAEYIAGIIVECIKLNRNICTIDISQYGISCKKLTVNIIRENLVAQISAKVNEIDTEGNANMILNVYKHIGSIGYSDKQLFYQIKEAIMHELGHWYFILTKYEKSGNVDTTSSNQLYLEVSNLIKDETVTGDVYYLAYAIYSIFGNELNAFVSQCHTQVYDYIIKRKDCSLDTVKDALRNSEVYETFITNINNVKHIIDYPHEKKGELIKCFNSAIMDKQCEIKTIEQLNKLLEFTLDKNMSALKMCSKTAVDAYYKYKNK